jgi:AAA domain-containing protein
MTTATAPDSLALRDEDTELLRRIAAGKDAQLFTQLFEASTPRPYESPSEPWARLLWLTAKYTQDPQQLLRIMAASSCKLPPTSRPGAAKRMAESAAYGAAVNAEPDAAERWRFYSAAELIALPEPPWLVPDMLFTGGLTLLYGQKGAYKSFLSLALATRVAFLVGPVVYVLAEGAGRFGQRVRAATSGITDLATRLRFVTVPVNLYDGDGPRFLQAVQADTGDGAAPVLYVFDTLARSMAGAEENSNRDVGLVVQAAQTLQATGAAVLLVHHTGKDGLDARGASALRNAADIVLKLERLGDWRTLLKFENIRDAAEPDPITWELRPWHGSRVPVAVAQGPAEPAAKDRRPTLAEQRDDLVRLCDPAPRTKDELAEKTGRSRRWLESELPVLVSAGRLKVIRTTVTEPWRYVSTRLPVDTV